MQAAYEIYRERMQGMHLLTMVFEDDCASIANIAVDPEYQGQGAAKGLMNFAVENSWLLYPV